VASAKTLIARLKGDPSVVVSVIKVTEGPGGHAIAVVAGDPGDAAIGLLHVASAVLAYEEGHPDSMPAEVVQACKTLRAYETSRRGAKGPLPYLVPDDA